MPRVTRIHPDTRLPREKGEDDTDRAADIDRGKLWEKLDAYRPEGQDEKVDYRQVLDSLNRRSGILVADSPTRYRFPHRSYQEDLAACHLSEREFPNLLARLVCESPNLWREVLLYAAGRAAKAGPFMAWALVETLVPLPPSDPLPAGDDPAWYAALFAGMAILEGELHRRTQEPELFPREYRIAGEGNAPAVFLCAGEYPFVEIVLFEGKRLE